MDSQPSMEAENTKSFRGSKHTRKQEPVASEMLQVQNEISTYVRLTAESQQRIATAVESVHVISPLILLQVCYQTSGTTSSKHMIHNFFQNLDFF